MSDQREPKVLSSAETYVLWALAEWRHGDPSYPMDASYLAQVTELNIKDCVDAVMALGNGGLVSKSPGSGILLTQAGREAANELAVVAAAGRVTEYVEGVDELQLAALDTVVEEELRVAAGAAALGHVRTAARTALRTKPALEQATLAINALVGSYLDIAGTEPSYRVNLRGLLASSWGRNSLTIIDRMFVSLRERKNRTPSLARYSWSEIRRACCLAPQARNLAYLALSHAKLGGNGWFHDRNDYWLRTPTELDVIVEQADAVTYLRSFLTKSVAAGYASRDRMSSRDRLRALLNELRSIAPWPWSNIGAWIARASPTIRSGFSSHFGDFEKLAKEPRWIYMPRGTSGGGFFGEPPQDNFAEAAAEEDRANRELAQESKQRLEQFVAGLLDAAEDERTRGATDSSLANVRRVVERFHLVARQLGFRAQKRKALEIGDEYDAQYLLNALLFLFFDDVRAEESTPTHAGGATRMDFLLKMEGIVLEVKFARPGHQDREIGDELLQDIERYKSHPDCKTLVCFIYDPSHCLRNPAGLATDLSRDTPLRVITVVRPS